MTISEKAAYLKGLMDGLELDTEKAEGKMISAIVDLVKQHDPGELVVGLPRNMDGSEGPRAALCRELASRLEQETGLPVVLWDERRTTIEAHSILHATGKKEKKHKGKVDAVAASLMLEGYLGSLR